MNRRIDFAGWVITATVHRGPDSGAVVTAGPHDTASAPGPQRGILAATSHTAEIATGGPALATDSAAILALSGLVDGYYSARSTFGRGQALAQAIEALNRWMFATHGQEAVQAGLTASLSALAFSGSRVGIIQIGAGLVLRQRDGEISRMTSPQLRYRPQGPLALRRAIGNDSRILLDYQDDAVLAGDRFIVISDIRDGDGSRIDTPALLGLCRMRAGDTAAALAETLSRFPAATPATLPLRSVLILDVESLPEPTITAAEAGFADLPPGPIPQEGQVLDGYRIGRTLHRGAYTLLKYAIDTQTREAVVLKFPLPAMLNDRVFQAGFARESWIGSSIHSPVIGRILPAEPGRRSQLYIVMPYYLGETLEERLTRTPSFSLPEIVAIGSDLAQAVEDLRAVQVLHRDLKPENVMLPNGGGLRLLDLGLAYLTGTEETAAQGLAGTLRYMAPEVIKGAPPDDRSEVYALGAILHRLTAYGRFPRPGADIAVLLMRERPDLPPSLCAAIASALDAEPTRRPPHAGALAHALSAALTERTAGRTAGLRFVMPAHFWRSVALILGFALLLSIALR